MSRLTGLSILSLLTVLVLVNGCYTTVEKDPIKTNPINAPDMRVIFNTDELASHNGLDADKCGVTNDAFKAYVRWYSEKWYDVDYIRWIPGNKLGVQNCIRYAVIYLKEK